MHDLRIGNSIRFVGIAIARLFAVEWLGMPRINPTFFGRRSALEILRILVYRDSDLRRSLFPEFRFSRSTGRSQRSGVVLLRTRDAHVIRPDSYAELFYSHSVA